MIGLLKGIKYFFWLKDQITTISVAIAMNSKWECRKPLEKNR
jgi:hypothetical protein